MDNKKYSVIIYQEIFSSNVHYNIHCFAWFFRLGGQYATILTVGFVVSCYIRYMYWYIKRYYVEVGTEWTAGTEP